MYSIDVSAVVTGSMPVPSVAGTQGWFATNADASSGIAPTPLTADWLNIIQAELLNLIEAAGETPDKTDQTQVLQAIRALINVGTSGIDLSNFETHPQAASLQATLQSEIDATNTALSNDVSTINTQLNERVFGDPAHHFDLGWDGTYVLASVDSQYVGQLDTLADVESRVNVALNTAQTFAQTAANNAQANAESYANGTLSGPNSSNTFPGGFRVQWGQSSTSTGNADQITFPVAFPNAVFTALAIEGNAASTWGGPSGPTLYGIPNLFQGGFQISCMINPSGTWQYHGGTGFLWLAIGY